MQNELMGMWLSSRFPDLPKQTVIKHFWKKFKSFLERIKYAYYDRVPYDQRPHQLWYRFKCWAWHRYTTIKPRYLDHTWVDRTAVLPHVMFEVLSQFIEKECCEPELVDWEASGHMVTVKGVKRNVRVEMQLLYDWWHQVYNKEYQEVHDILWKEIYAHPSTRDMIPVNEDHEEVPEDEAKWFLWEPEFPTPEDKEIHDKCLHAVNNLERMQEEELIVMMHRLVNLMPYLWT